MKKIILVAFLLISLNSYSQIEEDKVYHYGAGIGISAVSYFLTFNETNSHLKSSIVSLLIPTIIGVGKELIDNRKGGSGFNGEDLLYTMGGAITFTITVNLFDVKVREEYR